jgi:hypothetical protein
MKWWEQEAEAIVLQREADRYRYYVRVAFMMGELA